MDKKTEEQIKNLEALIAAPGVPQDEKDFAQRKIEKLKAQAGSAAPAEKKPEPKPEKQIGRPKGRKQRSLRGAKARLKDVTISIDGKPVKINEANCFDVVKEVARRQEQIREAGKKYRVKPVIHKAADNIEQAVKQVAEGVSESRMENNAGEVMKGVKQIEAALEKFLEGIEKVTGKKVPAEKRKQILDILTDLKEEVAAQ